MSISPLISRGIDAVRLEALPKNLTEVIPDTKVFKEMTNLDKNCIVNYIQAKSYKMGITADEVAELSKFDGVDFVVNSYDFLTKKLGLTEDIRPALFNMSIPGDAAMFYSPAVNIIYADLAKCAQSKFDKGDLFKMLRHEMQHFLQYCTVLRHQTLGEKVIDFKVNEFVTAIKENLSNVLNTYSLEQLAQMGISPEELNLYKTAKSCLDKNDIKGFNQICEYSGESQKNALLEYRQKLINKMGLIKEDSALTPKAQSLYDEFCNIGYFNQDKTIDMKKYMASKIENEAIISQVQAELEYRQVPCGVKYIRETTIDAFNNPELKKVSEELYKAMNNNE